MSETVRIPYAPPNTDIVIALHEESDYQRDGSSGATADEISDLLSEAAAEIKRLREQLGRAEISFQQCDSDRRSFAARTAKPDRAIAVWLEPDDLEDYEPQEDE